MSEDLAVSLGDEFGAAGDQLGSQFLGVLDDPVVDDRDRPAHVGVSIRITRLAVRGPSGVADAWTALEPGGDVGCELRDPAFRLAHPQVTAPANDGNPGRVVTAVLKPGQA